jgi:hypothetical protein
VLREPEISKFDDCIRGVFGEEQVLWLDVPMDNVFTM